MTGIVLKDPSANYRDNALGWVGCPVSASGLEFVHFFGGSLSRCLKNYAPGKSDASVTGAPTVNANSISLQGGTSYLTSCMADTPSKTLVAVYRMTEDADAMIIANTVDTDVASNRKTALFQAVKTAADGQNQLSFLHASDTVGTVVEVGAQYSVNVPLCAALRFDSAEAVLYGNNLTTGASGSVAIGGARTAGSALRIGWGYRAGSYLGRSEVYAAIGFSRKLSDIELNTLYRYLKTYCARRGITA